MKEKPRRFLKYQVFWFVSYDLENGNKRLEQINAWDLKQAYDQFGDRVSSRAQQIKANKKSAQEYFLFGNNRLALGTTEDKDIIHAVIG